MGSNPSFLSIVKYVHEIIFVVNKCSSGLRGLFPLSQCICSSEINQLAPQSDVCDMVVAQETFIVNSEQARQQAERRFKQEERGRDGRKAIAEYEAEARAIREKTARLKALRLAKEAQARNEQPPPKLLDGCK